MQCLLLLFGRGMFLTEGFPANNRLPEVPRPLPGGQTFCFLFRLSECSRGIHPWHTENESPQRARGLVIGKGGGVFSSGGDEVASYL
jgi:hypothetical protein